MFKFYDALAKKRLIRFLIDGEGVVYGDRSMMQRAISILVSNALSYSKANSDVRVLIDQPSPSCQRMIVENDGETIPPEHFPRLFDRFYRIDASRRRRSEGAGLGLAIVKSIVQRHRGSIDVFSENGKTRFTVVLPSG